MNKWRIKIVGNSTNTYYILQKRLFGVLWWYNPNNIDAYTTGLYNTLSEALDSYHSKIEKDIIIYLGIDDAKKHIYTV